MSVSTYAAVDGTETSLLNFALARTGRATAGTTRPLCVRAPLCRADILPVLRSAVACGLRAQILYPATTALKVPIPRLRVEHRGVLGWGVGGVGCTKPGWRIWAGKQEGVDGDLGRFMRLWGRRWAKGVKIR